ncbi:DUF1440 domain-containing protein [Spirosoma sp. KNUC1025]|uniref:DUF1440 domain-containing protein n=1 Tax=Spirosoma sp. KNUC1025 TaxID=2894082 RepID=UPI003863BB5F|nr:DUF1440 domain-containing protein [Spirosoma sp. KNUC1025]
MQINSSSATKSIPIIIRAGLVAGTLDALAAMVMFMIRGGKNPAAVWRYVASGVFGKEALTGGTDVVVWGLIFHFLIALIWAVIFFVIYPTLCRFINNPIITGLLYGVLVWVVMNLIVLPLSHVPPVPPFDLSKALIGMVIIMVCVGLPIARITHNYYSNKS